MSYPCAFNASFLPPLSHFEARLPSNATLAQLRALADANFSFVHVKSFRAILIACTCGLGVVVLIGVFILVRRLAERTFWLFRVQETRGCLLYIPNAQLSFVFIEAIWAALFTSWMWNIEVNGDGHGTNSAWVAYTACLLFLPLILGAWCCAFGVAYAIPGIINQPAGVVAAHLSTSSAAADATADVPRPQTWSHWRPSPRTLNLLFFGAPCTLAIAMAVLSCAAGVSVASAARICAEWVREMQDAGRDWDAVASEADRQRAAMIWYKNTQGWWWSCLGFKLWAVYSSLFALLLAIVSVALATTIRKHLVSKYPDPSLPARRINATDLFLANGSDNTAYPASVPAAVRSSQGGLIQGTSTLAAYRLIITLCSLIEVAVLCYCILTSIMGARGVDELLASPMDFGRFITKLLLAAFWIAIVFGGACFGVISLKVLQPLFINRNDRRRGSAAPQLTEHVRPDPESSFSETAMTTASLACKRVRSVYLGEESERRRLTHSSSRISLAAVNASATARAVGKGSMGPNLVRAALVQSPSPVRPSSQWCLRRSAEGDAPEDDDRQDEQPTTEIDPDRQDELPTIEIDTDTKHITDETHRSTDERARRNRPDLSRASSALSNASCSTQWFDAPHDRTLSPSPVPPLPRNLALSLSFEARFPAEDPQATWQMYPEPASIWPSPRPPPRKRASAPRVATPHPCSRPRDPQSPPFEAQSDGRPESSHSTAAPQGGSPSHTAHDDAWESTPSIDSPASRTARPTWPNPQRSELNAEPTSSADDDTLCGSTGGR